MRAIGRPARAVAIGATFVVCLASASAATLKFDGKDAVLKQVGSSLNLTLSGAPGQSAYLMVDAFGGPTNFLGRTLGIGLSPLVQVYPIGNLPGSGSVSFNFTLPSDPAFDGKNIFATAVVLDANALFGIDFSNGASVQFSALPFRKTELAGKTVASYPFFQYVRAFNQTLDPIQIAIDPARYPFVVGQTAKAYVVASKSTVEWDVNPALIDVTNNGADTISFVAGGIQGDTFTVDPGSLSGDAGASIGVPYDVVLDLNQNGLLDAGDVIDGYSTEAGLYVVHDLTKPGPYAVTEVIYTGGTWLGQDLYYPTNVASLGQLPLVTISHGNGHNYQWYDYIGNHLASYGYIVMSHENNTGPGIETASTTTLTNNDYFLSHLATIAGGALLGHVDSHHTTWIGHSRGAEGICRAYQRIFSGSYVPTNYVLSDLKLLSSMAPTDFLGPSQSNPHDVDYHLWTGGADNDVNGCANNDIAQTYHLLERATGNRQSTELHGVGHGDFHDSTGSVASGPCLTGKPNAHLEILGYFLPLVKFHIEGNLPAKDFLTRQWEDLHPIGAPVTSTCSIVDLQYRESPLSGKYVIDDFQTNTATNLASSGAAVTATVTSLQEGVMNDATADFTNSAADPWNGFTEAAAADTTRGAVFEYSNADAFIRYSMPAPNQDLSSFRFLSLRACQATRNPLTTAALGDLTFTVTLTDVFGHSGAINIGAYGGGIEEPYQRTSCGTGTGWGNEFETIRLRLTDFERNSTQLDLSRIATVELDFGPSYGAAQGRLGLDDVELTKD